ncbi:hypothetical protein AgCh_015312 [Apium graveolens]
MNLANVVKYGANGEKLILLAGWCCNLNLRLVQGLEFEAAKERNAVKKDTTLLLEEYHPTYINLFQEKSGTRGRQKCSYGLMVRGISEVIFSMFDKVDQTS